MDVQQIWTFHFVSHSCSSLSGNYCLWNDFLSCERQRGTLSRNQEEVFWFVHLQESSTHRFHRRIRFQHVRLLGPFCSSGELNYFRWISYVHFYFFYRYYSFKIFRSYWLLTVKGLNPGVISWVGWVWSSGGSTNVQRWPQDPYFPFSSLVLHFSEVWKCEITLLSFLIPSSILIKRVEVWNSLTKSG